MLIDILIAILLVTLAVFGYMKGFIVGILNLLFFTVYAYFSNDVLNIVLKNLASPSLVKDLDNSPLLKYFIILIIGLIIGLILNLVLRKIVKKSVLSGFDHFGGLIIHVLAGYLVLCLVLIIYSSLVPFIEVPNVLKESYFFSDSFKDYNIIVRWWLNAK